MAEQAEKSQTGMNRSSNRARAIIQLDRIAGFGRRADRIVKASAGLTKGMPRRWQLSVQVLPAQFAQANRQGKSDRSQSRFDEALNRNETNQERKLANKLRRAASIVDAGGRVSKKSRGLASAIESLSRVESSVEAGGTARAISNASRRAIDVAKKVVVPSTGSSPSSDRAVARGSQEGVDGAVSRFAHRDLSAHARTAPIRGATILPNVSQRPYAELSGRARGSNNGSTTTGITINSSPTVVINAPASAANAARDVISALRTYREELFDQMKRESTRRERVQF